MTKYIFKEALQPWLPADLIHRKKMGFGIPHEQWLRESLRPMVHDLLLSPSSVTAGYLRSDQVRRWVTLNRDG